MWQCNLMPFGLKGASATLRRLSLALGHLSPIQLALYMADIYVISETFEEHLQRMRNRFEALLRHGLRIKAETCSFAMNEDTLWPQD